MLCVLIDSNEYTQHTIILIGSYPIIWRSVGGPFQTENMINPQWLELTTSQNKFPWSQGCPCSWFYYTFNTGV